MKIQIYSIDEDKVIQSNLLTGEVDYEYALKNFYPLINRLKIQRKLQDTKFYKRLEKDIIEGCIMPPITIAFVDKEQNSQSKEKELLRYLSDNMSKGFILDGIQRLNTLNRVKENHKDKLDLARPLLVNIIICPSRDNLLYRMVTLNNGQKPMTARHQIEILASYIYDFDSIGLEIITEKESANKRNPKAFRKADVISSYIAFLSDTPNLDNNKIIQEKMDELIARKIIESDITTDGIEFIDVLIEISRLKESEYNLKWLKNNNNLIGFSLGIKKSLESIKKTSLDDFQKSLEEFEKAFSNFDVSKIKLSRERRKLSRIFIEEYPRMKDMDNYDLLLEFNELD